MPEFFKFEETEEPKKLADSSKIGNEEVNESKKFHLRFSKRYETFLSSLRRRKDGEPITEEDVATINKRLEGLASLDEYIRKHHGREGEITLHEEQMDVFENLRLFLEQGETEGYIKLPTGVGKTVIFTEFLEAFNQKTLIAVPTKLLVDQTGKKIERFASDVEFGKIYQYAKDFGKQVSVTTYSSLAKQIKQGGINPKEFNLLILDEVHESLTEKRSEAVQKFTNAIKIGFTATPQYSDKKSVADVLLGAEIYEMDIKEAAEKGLIAPFSVIIAQTETDLSNVKVTSNGDYDEGELEKAINIESRNQAAVRLYQELFNGKKAVINTVNLAHAQQVSEIFEQAGVPSAMIYGGNTEQERSEILEKFASGKILALCNVDVLARGFDEPSAEVCFNLRPTLSRVRAEQRGGRVLRFDPLNAGKLAFIVDFLDKNDDKKYLPLSFADIAGEAVVFGPDETGEDWILGGNRGQEKTKKDKLEEVAASAEGIRIEGLQITVKASEVMRIIREKESQKYEIAPNGWMTINALRESLGIGNSTTQAMLKRYSVSNPEWFEIYLDKKGRPFRHLHPDLVASVRELIGASREFGLAPDGWMTADSIRKRLHIGNEQIIRILNQYKISNPDWIKPYLNEKKLSFDYVHPDLIAILTDKYYDRLQIGLAPEGWKTMQDMRNDLVVSIKPIKKIVSHYRESNPEYFKTFLGGTDKTRNAPYEFLHPDLVAIINKSISEKRELGQAPKGWMTSGDIAKQAGVRSSSVDYYIKKNKQENEKNFRWYLGKNNQPAEFASPEISKIILGEYDKLKEKIKNYEEAPAGWATQNELAEKIGFGKWDIKRIIEEQRVSHPESIKPFLNKRKNRVFEYYSPELVSMIEKNIKIIGEKKNELGFAPSGWETLTEIAGKLGRKRESVKSDIDELVIVHPDWKKKFLNQRRREFEYYDPNLVEFLLKQSPS